MLQQQGRSEIVERLELADGGLALVITGAGGSGKSTVLEAVGAIAARRGRRVVHCRGRRNETNRELGAIEPLLDPRAEAAATEAALAALAAEPTALLVDDAHWLDPASADVLTAVAERVAELDTWLVVAHTAGVVSTGVAQLRAAAPGPAHLGPVPVDRFTDLGSDGAAMHDWTGGWCDYVTACAESGPGHVPSPVLDDAETRLGLLPLPARSIAFALAFEAGIDNGGAARAAALDTHDLDAALEELRIVGLLRGDGFAPVLSAAVRRLMPPAARAALLDRLLENEPQPAHTLRLAELLRATGDRSVGAGRLYERAGGFAEATSANEAMSWHELALECGAGSPAMAATAMLRAGEPGRAVQLLGSAPARDGHEAEAFGLALAQLGRTTEAAHHLKLADSPAAAWTTALAGAGTSTITTPADPQAATLVTGAMHWRAGEPAPALDAFRRARRDQALAGTRSPWPDSVHAAACLLALQALDPTEAATALDEADVADTAGAIRHRAVAAFAAMRQSRIAEAQALLDDLDTEAAGPRDTLVIAATKVGVALRTNALDELTSALQAAEAAWSCVDPDLAHLQVIGEIVVGAARMRHLELHRRVLADLDQLAERTGAAPFVQFHLAWVRLTAALTADDIDTVAAAARVVVDLELDGRFGPPGEAAALLVAAHEGQVDTQATLRVSGELEALGLTFEASRLLGALALQATEESDVKTLLRASRQARAARVGLATGPRDAVALTHREIEVAREIVEGRTHKEIGAALFISPKTVEHHVARIRRKLGAGDRAQMLASLRSYLATANA